MTLVSAARLLDTPPEEAFDRLTRLAARLLGAPVALVTLADDRRVFFKSAVGLPEPWASRRSTPLSYSFCRHVIATGQPLPSPPTMLSFGIRASSMNSSLNSASPVIWRSGRTCTASCSMSMMK